MVFKCQENAFLKKFTTKIVYCEPAFMQWLPHGLAEAKEIAGFNIICEDTILFPEGGGQPCDYGTINNEPVRNVVRKGSQAIHFVECSNGFEVGTIVEQCLDWSRRLDHMQQHSGQHLITEVFDKEFDYDTTSWWLGSDVSYIELNTKRQITKETLDLIENKCNEMIREGKDVNMALVDPNSPEMKGIRARTLPKDVEGPVRVIRIEGQKDNMCCGTHVSNLSQIQAVKLLFAEKAKNGTNVHFVTGQRVLKQLGECFQREQQLNLALKGGPNHHLELLQKLQNSMKLTKKSFQKVLKDLAMAEAEKLQRQLLPAYYSLHRQDGIEPDFINIFLKYAPDEVDLYFLTVSEPSLNNTPGKGQMVLRGKPDLVQHFGKKFLEILGGKGNGREGSYQAKVNNTSKIPECEILLEEYFQKNKPSIKAS